jgi:acetyl esterase/lipase
MTGNAPHVRTIEGHGSWRSRVLSALLRVASRTPLAPGTDIAALRRHYEALDARYFAPDRSVVREAIECDGVHAEWINVPESLPGRVVFYLHGGSFAFRFPNAHAAFAGRLCQRLGARALVPDYRLAPEHPYPAAPDDCLAAYRWLLASGADPRSVIVVGDSAGGNLALVTLRRARRAHLAMPSCAVLLSPAVDCTLASRSIVANGGRDPMLSLPNLLVLRGHYVPSTALYTDPDVSPLFADFTGFPPLFLQAGSSEILRDEAVRTAQRAHDAGVDVELELWPETLHAFQIASFLPEAAQAIDQIVGFVAARTGWAPPPGAPPRTNG